MSSREPPGRGSRSPPNPPRPTAPPTSSHPRGAVGSMAALHVRSRRWPLWGQIAWWVLLLPVAMACWGASRGSGVRVGVWIAAVVVAVLGGSTIAGALSGPDGTSGGSPPGASRAPVTTVEVSTASVTAAPTTAREAVPATATTFPTATAPVTTPTPTAATVPATAPTPVTTTPLGSVSALDVLNTIAVANEHQAGYDRKLFPLWADDDHDGCDTRAEVLVRDAVTPPLEGAHCGLSGGMWLSPYDNETLTSPTEVQIDHVVALKEAWDSGAWAWTTPQRQAYANDLSDARTLRAVSAASNNAKGDKDPSNWLPPNPADECSYIGDWIAIKARWQLTMDQSEHGRLANLLGSTCQGLLIAPRETVTIVPTTTVAPPAAQPAPPPQPATTAAEAPNGGGVVYANCAAARAAGVAPLHRGDPGYSAKLDRDGDGIACE